MRFLSKRGFEKYGTYSEGCATSKTSKESEDHQLRSCFGAATGSIPHLTNAAYGNKEKANCWQEASYLNTKRLRIVAPANVRIAPTAVQEIEAQMLSCSRKSVKPFRQLLETYRSLVRTLKCS